jgi:hypothetical protein
LARVHGEATFVRFESRRLFVNVYHGRKSFEIGLELGQTGSDEGPYSMWEILRLVEAEDAAAYRNFAATTAGGVAEGVARLASLFRVTVEGGILDDPGLFVRLARQRAAVSEAYAREVELAHAREALDAAWQARDYAKVVELLEPLRDDLTPSERQKLDIAKRRG